ncbi:hypothetical protein FM038_000905 [Shewanella eurypsychrophilus]|uniref:Outer membrane protein n=1 Tax=Shewanella eurypsychrophilus TaxID=2593656 RepID=A0ABX6V0N1_9GAMM|nr:hypothetical protein FS418_00895 [Shewanella sp. YLB-09]QFU25140.1 hypothetical protein FS418_02505 [Shewanella sp. YLB-09]QPG56143.2 hypothetical protein FM038_000905 [Shewanella eurypsychrophilus]
MKASITIALVMSAPTQASQESSVNPYAISVLAGLESYPDSEASSMSRGGGLSFIWDDLRYNNVYQLDTNYFRVRGTYYYERDAEKYDEDRYRNSADLKLNYQRPFYSFGEEQEYLLSIHGRYEGHYNSQQLEEFEQLAVAGLAFNTRFSGTNHYDLGLILGLGYSEEEKDDDWPREEMGHGEDVLNRAGFGYFFEWSNAYTFAHSGVQLTAKFSRFDGNWSYDAGQFYKVDRLTLGAVVPLANENNLLHFSSQYITRDYELDLIGFEDTLYRVAVEYVHYF